MRHLELRSKSKQLNALRRLSCSFHIVVSMVLCSYRRFFLVTMMTKVWRTTDWKGLCQPSLFGCCPMTSRTASTFAWRSWAVVMVSRLMKIMLCWLCGNGDIFPEYSSHILLRLSLGNFPNRFFTSHSGWRLQREGIPVRQRSLCTGRVCGSCLWWGQWLWGWIRWEVLWWVIFPDEFFVNYFRLYILN